MPSTKVKCRVIAKRWLTPTVMGLEFEPSKKFRFEGGQFLSIYVPDEKGGKPLRRAYSFASHAAHAPKGERPYQLCIKVLIGGPGSQYLATLEIGEAFDATAPYGDFLYESEEGRRICMIATGSGIAPFRAMALSEPFHKTPPSEAFLIFGARTADEILYPRFFESHGFNVFHAISTLPREQTNENLMPGRVTDCLRNLPADWGWQQTDFYLCGSGEMVQDVRRLLLSRGVPAENIRQEVYFTQAASRVDSQKKAA